MINTLASQVESGNVIITRAPSSLAYHVYVLERLPDGRPINVLYLSKGIIKKQKYSEGRNDYIPFFVINYGEAEKLYTDLLDAFIQLGIKPKHQIATKEETNALLAHLSDMRKIVAKKLKVEL